MNSSNRTIEGFIKYGKRTTPLIEFNDHTTMAVVNQHIHKCFSDFLPSAYHIEFYSDKKNIFLQLDEKVLNSELNPFQFDSNNSSQEIISVMDCVQLFIVEDPSPLDRINSQPSTLLDTKLSSKLGGAMFITKLSFEFNNASAFFKFSLWFYNKVHIATTYHKNISKNAAAADSVDDSLSTAENASNPHVDSQNSTASSNECQLATETTDENNTQFSRICFSHDVQPEQKHHYLSNKYNTETGSDGNSGISYIQGVKTKEEKEKRTPILPHLRISPSYRDIENCSLLIYAVFEELENEMRIWYKNPYKGFLLHDQLKPDAELSNPMMLNLNNTQWKEDGDYILEIYMLTNTRIKRSTIKEEVYRLDKDATKQIHKAEHIKCSKRKHLKPTRLLVVAKIGNKIYWSTCGLSNFIQPPITSPRSKTLNGSTTVQIELPESNINLNTVGLPVVLQPSTKISQPMSLNAITAVPTASPVPKRKKI